MLGELWKSLGEVDGKLPRGPGLRAGPAEVTRVRRGVSGEQAARGAGVAGEKPSGSMLEAQVIEQRQCMPLGDIPGETRRR